MYTPVEKGFLHDFADVSEYIEVKMIFAEVLSRFTPAEDPFLFYFRSHFVPLFGLYQTVRRRIRGQTVANHTEATFCCFVQPQLCSGLRDWGLIQERNSKLTLKNSSSLCSRSSLWFTITGYNWLDVVLYTLCLRLGEGHLGFERFESQKKKLAKDFLLLVTRSVCRRKAAHVLGMMRNIVLDTASKLLHATFAVHFDKLNQSIIYCLPIFLFCCVFFLFFYHKLQGERKKWK